MLHDIMQQNAIIEKNEQSMVVATYPDGRQYVFSWGDSTPTSVKPDDATNAMVQRFLDEGASIDIIHTHPLESIVTDPDQLNRIRNGEAPMPTMQPSLRDIATAVIYANSPNGANVISHVADPSGVWTYKVDMNDPNAKAFFDTVKVAQEGKKADYSNYTQALKIIGSAENNYTPYKSNDPQERQNLIDAYGKIGVTLSFTPHK